MTGELRKMLGKCDISSLSEEQMLHLRDVLSKLDSMLDAEAETAANSRSATARSTTAEIALTSEFQALTSLFHKDVAPSMESENESDLLSGKEFCDWASENSTFLQTLDSDLAYRSSTQAAQFDQETLLSISRSSIDPAGGSDISSIAVVSADREEDEDKYNLGNQNQDQDHGQDQGKDLDQNQGKDQDHAKDRGQDIQKQSQKIKWIGGQRARVMGTVNVKEKGKGSLHEHSLGSHAITRSMSSTNVQSPCNRSPRMLLTNSINVSPRSGYTSRPATPNPAGSFSPVPGTADMLYSPRSVYRSIDPIGLTTQTRAGSVSPGPRAANAIPMMANPDISSTSLARPPATPLSTPLMPAITSPIVAPGFDSKTLSKSSLSKGQRGAAQAQALAAVQAQKLVEVVQLQAQARQTAQAHAQTLAQAQMRAQADEITFKQEFMKAQAKNQLLAKSLGIGKVGNNSRRHYGSQQQQQQQQHLSAQSPPLRMSPAPVPAMARVPSQASVPPAHPCPPSSPGQGLLRSVSLPANKFQFHPTDHSSGTSKPRQVAKPGGDSGVTDYRVSL